MFLHSIRVTLKSCVTSVFTRGSGTRLGGGAPLNGTCAVRCPPEHFLSLAEGMLQSEILVRICTVDETKPTNSHPLPTNSATKREDANATGMRVVIIGFWMRHVYFMSDVFSIKLIVHVQRQLRAFCCIVNLFKILLVQSKLKKCVPKHCTVRTNKLYTVGHNSCIRSP